MARSRWNCLKNSLVLKWKCKNALAHVSNAMTSFNLPIFPFVAASFLLVCYQIILQEQQWMNLHTRFFFFFYTPPSASILSISFFITIVIVWNRCDGTFWCSSWSDGLTVSKKMWISATTFTVKDSDWFSTKCIEATFITGFNQSKSLISAAIVTKWTLEEGFHFRFAFFTRISQIWDVAK